MSNPHSHKVIGAQVAALKQQLAAALNKLEMAEACLAGDNALIAGLKNDLAAALVACKLKDEALSKIEHLESANGCIMSAGDCSSVATEALSTTPDQALEQFATLKGLK